MKALYEIPCITSSDVYNKSMAKPAPTQSEIIALQYLWERGRATVPELHTDICKNGKVGYTTVLKRIQRMEEKGFVKKVATDGRAHAYVAVLQPQSTRKNLLTKLIKSAFDDSPNALIQHAIGQSDLTKNDIAEIRSLHDRVEKGD